MTRTFLTLKEILSILSKVQLSQCLLFCVRRKQSRVSSFYLFIGSPELWTMQSKFLMCYLSAKGIIARLKLGLCGRHESSAPF